MQSPLATAVLAAALLSPSVDVLLPGQKYVDCIFRVEITPAARRTTIVGYRIVGGDTFSTIAARELGDADRARGIAALNPSFAPDQLPIDAVIWLPPTDPEANDADTHYLFNRCQLSFSADPFVPSGDIGDHYGGGVVAIPTAHLAEYLTLATANDPASSSALATAEWLGESEKIPRVRTMPAASKTDRVERECVVTAIDDGTPRLEHVEDRHFDSGGERVDPRAMKQTRLLLALLAALGAGGLVWFAFRRRGRTPSSPPA